MIIQTRIKRHATGGWNIEACIGGVWEFMRWTDGSRDDARECERDVRARLKGETL